MFGIPLSSDPWSNREACARLTAACTSEGLIERSKAM